MRDSHVLSSVLSRRGLVFAPHHRAAAVGASVLAEGGNVAEAMVAGMSDYLSKPIDPQALFGVIARFGGGAEPERPAAQAAATAPVIEVLRTNPDASDPKVHDRAGVFDELLATLDDLSKGA